jgi:hypothetical protein
VDGWLYLGFNDRYYGDNRGSFEATIVVWNTQDYAEIGKFLEVLKHHNPEHEGIRYAFNEAQTVVKSAQARVQAAQAVEATQSEIEALTRSPAGKQSSTEGATRKRIEELEARLSQLADELAEKTLREQDLTTQISAGSKNPPMLLVATPVDAQQTGEATVRLSGVAEDNAGLQDLTVHVNGQRLKDKDGRGIKVAAAPYPKRFEFNREITLVPGENRIRIVVTDTDGLRSEDDLRVYYRPSRGTLWAVVVGINGYPRLPHLKYAVKDAMSFYHLLVDDNHFLQGFKREFLPPHRQLIHESALDVHEDGHAVDIAVFGLGTGLGAGAGAGGYALGTGLGLGTRRDGHGRSIGVKLESAAGEGLIGALVLKKDDFTEGLAAQLESD